MDCTCVKFHAGSWVWRVANASLRIKSSTKGGCNRWKWRDHAPLLIIGYVKTHLSLTVFQGDKPTKFESEVAQMSLQCGVICQYIDLWVCLKLTGQTSRYEALIPYCRHEIKLSLACARAQKRQGQPSQPHFNPSNRLQVLKSKSQ